ncbi:MAG: PEP-CTERM sorting domain-containing protein [Fimbriimonadaceae bacterium]
MNLYKIGAVMGLATFAISAQAVSTINEDFNSWSLGSGNQNGWAAYGNSAINTNVQNTVSRSGNAVELRTHPTDQSGLVGVVNGYHSAFVDYAGESTISQGTTNNDRLNVSFWYRTPDSNALTTTSWGGILELNPSFDTNRYGWVGLIDGAKDTTNFYNASDGLVFELDTILNLNDTNASYDPIATNLSYASWYRLEYSIQFVNGINGDESPNDVMTVSVFDESNSLLGSATGSTWESGFRGAYAFGNPGPHGVNGMDFRARAFDNDVNLGYIDDFRMESVPEPASMTLLAIGALAALKKRKSK